jgi:hypothetical protein
MPPAPTPASASGGIAAPSTIGSGLKVYHGEMRKTGVLLVLGSYLLSVMSGVDLSICTRGLGIFSCRRRSAFGFEFSVVRDGTGYCPWLELGELMAMCTENCCGWSAVQGRARRTMFVPTSAVKRPWGAR